MYTSLRCYDCDNAECVLCSLGKFIDSDSLQGCTRQLNDDMYSKYEHISKEVLPFAARNKNIDFQEIDKVYNYVYNNCKIGTMLNEKGKAIRTKKKIIDKLNQHVL